MTYLLDTCVLSELRKPVPSQSLVSWIRDVEEDDLYVSVLTLAELHGGVSALDPGRKKRALQAWLEEVRDGFADRVLDIDLEIACQWAQMRASLRQAGIQLPPVDGLLAATAQQKNLVLVTRNLRDFVATGVPMVNPW